MRRPVRHPPRPRRYKSDPLSQIHTLRAFRIVAYDAGLKSVASLQINKR
jgi:hypothetical protein